MEKVFFKIVIPNYNNIAYLPQCLDSILNQTFQDFRIILVDDQSTDFSYELAKSYERKYPDKMTVLRAETKRYAGGCRNIGIDYPLDCKYNMFVDSDDYLYSSNALSLIKKSLYENPDILLFGWCFDINGRILKNKLKKFSAYTGKFASTPWNASWSRVVKVNFIEKFLEQCMRGEDTYQFLKMLDKNPVIRQIDSHIYVYRQIQSSTIHQPIFKQHRPILIQALKDLRNIVKNKDVIVSINRRLGE